MDYMAELGRIGSCWMDLTGLGHFVNNFIVPGLGWKRFQARVWPPRGQMRPFWRGGRLLILLSPLPWVSWLGAFASFDVPHVLAAESRWRWRGVEVVDWLGRLGRGFQCRRCWICFRCRFGWLGLFPRWCSWWIHNAGCGIWSLVFHRSHTCRMEFCRFCAGAHCWLAIHLPIWCWLRTIETLKMEFCCWQKKKTNILIPSVA